jgi:RNA polymerase sporulation-specific sigma factor
MFSTYAVPVILGELKRLFRDGGAIKVSRHLRELNLKIGKAAAELENKQGREATLLEISEYLGVDIGEVTEAVCACRETVSLTVSNDEHNLQLDVAEDSGEENLNNKIMLDGAFSVLTDVERHIIIYRYYNGLTQSETAKHLSMSQVQVSRLEKKILLKLRSRLQD